MTCDNEHACGCGKGGCDKTAMMLGLAHHAKMALLKEKMKQRFEATHGEKFEKVAALVVDALLAKKKAKEGIEEQMDQLRGKLEKVWESG